MKELITANLDIWSSAVTAKTSGAGRSSGNKGAYGINKLRELILELAVRGKLVPQDPNDEPASELLKKIEKEKENQIKSGKIRKRQTIPEIEESERLFGLPSYWVWTRLGEIGDWGAGATPLRSVSSYYGGKTPWFKSGELSADYIDSSEETITELALKECSLRLNNPGDVLIAMYGATIGKTSILKVAGTTNQAVCACTVFSGVYNRYLLTLLKAMKSNFIGQGAGGAQPNISREKIVGTVFALPPLAEQHRIVAKVDELMTLCDQLETEQASSAEAHEKLVSILLDALTQGDSFTESWARLQEHFDVLFTTPASIDKLKQTLLQLAVMGKLVRQDSNDEPASELLKKVRKEKNKLIADGKIKKEKPLPSITDEEKPFDLPIGWVWVRLGEIVKISGGKRVANGYQFEKVPTPYIYIRVSDMKNGTIDDSDLRYIDSEMREKIGRYIITKNDIYMTIVGATIGKCGLVPEKFDQMNLTENAARLAPWTEVDKTFVFKCLDGKACQIQFVDKTKQVGVQKMALNRLASTILPLPPYQEQRRIVAKVDELMALCDQVKSQLVEAGEQQRNLADVMVERAVA